MLGYFLSFLLGAIVMDFLWAYKLGIAQIVWARIRGSK